LRAVAGECPWPHGEERDVMRLWNYAVKVAALDAASVFYTDNGVA